MPRAMRRILFITSTRIGDAVLSSGLLDHLARAHPDAATTVACGPLAAPLFRAAPGVERIVIMKKRKGGGHWIDLWRAAVATRWDLVVDLRDQPRCERSWKRDGTVKARSDGGMLSDRDAGALGV